ncbi:hypothetical protein A1359_19310 [Methylomonas lenta]|uniref:Uncharacterized protein n=1 Tax=Methylomonas lenta TaxID=980561 RepID=A0A177NU04_9GAMM|nr:hypothetical protein A1359_19310 [Methylomonas lenta]
MSVGHFGDEAKTTKRNVAKVYRKYVLSYHIFATQKTLNLLGLPDCRITFNFRDNPLMQLVTNYCSAEWPALMQLGLPIFATC